MDTYKCFLVTIFFIIIIGCCTQMYDSGKEGFAESEKQGFAYEQHLENIIKQGQQSQLHVHWANQHDPGDLYVEPRGWWIDTINCTERLTPTIYCKPKEKWIWPY